MNEKIKELMFQHGLHKYVTEDCQRRMELLSSVIVKECAKVAREYTLRKSGLDSSYDGTVYIEEEIKNHFSYTPLPTEDAS